MIKEGLRLFGQDAGACHYYLLGSRGGKAREDPPGSGALACAEAGVGQVAA